MPKNIKLAPPQQSNLAEMWGKKRKSSVKEDFVKEEPSEAGDVQVEVKHESRMHFELHYRGVG